jgi:hypothetical protein
LAAEIRQNVEDMEYEEGCSCRRYLSISLALLSTHFKANVTQQRRNQRSVQPKSASKKVCLTTRESPDDKLTTLDLTELSLPSTMRISFSNPDDILNFTLTIEPDEGIHTLRNGND